MLAVSGTADIRPHWPVQQLVHLTPDAHVELIDGAGHLPWLTHGDRLRALLRAFLAPGSATE